ncbi:MAG: LysE family transporter [Chloroflexi bacterium]|nr:LysE family transporter [Chloroflexota bacterium]
MEALFFTAFAMSLAFAAQPGIIGFESLRRGLSHGWTAALHVELGSLLGDGVWAIIALLGVSVLFQNRLITFALGLFGCALLLRFAWEAWEASRGDLAFDGGNDERKNHLLAGAMLSLSNPQNITFWVGMSGTIIGIGFLDPEPKHLLAFFAGFMIAQVCWCFFFATVVEIGRRRLLNQRLFRWVNLACAVFLGCAGIKLLLQTAQATLGAL